MTHQGTVYLDSMTTPTLSCPTWTPLPHLSNNNFKNINYQNILNVGYGGAQGCPSGQVKYYATMVNDANHAQNLQFCAAPAPSGQTYPQNYPWDTMQAQWQSLSTTTPGIAIRPNNQPPMCEYKSSSVEGTLGATYSNVPKDLYAK